MVKARRVNDFKIPKDKNLEQNEFPLINGVAGNYINEYKYKFFKLQNEKIVSKGDSYIVLGRDRPGSSISGYGGRGSARANSIDIVVGRLSCAMDEVELAEKEKWVNPDFSNDAARIHLSQRTDIDANFNLPQGKVGNNSTSKSGIAIKADNLRFIARAGIKIISSNDSIDSMGLVDAEKVGIDLIAGVPYSPTDNNQNVQLGLTAGIDDMQPIPKGNNLIECIRELSKQVDQLSGVLATFASAQLKYNTELAVHTHISPFNGIPTPPSTELVGPIVDVNLDTLEKVLTDIINLKTEHIPSFNSKYLSKISTTYINSRYHNLN